MGILRVNVYLTDNINKGKKMYNGFKNYETWVVALWLDQDETYWREEAQACYDNSFNDLDDARYHLSALLKEQHESMAGEIEAAVFSDLLNGALSEVNWDEIATGLLKANFFRTSKKEASIA